MSYLYEVESKDYDYPDNSQQRFESSMQNILYFGNFADSTGEDSTLLRVVFEDNFKDKSPGLVQTNLVPLSEFMPYLDEALDILDERDKRFLIQHYSEGKTLKEIAEDETLQVSESLVWLRNKKSKRMLSRYLLDRIGALSLG